MKRLMFVLMLLNTSWLFPKLDKWTKIKTTGINGRSFYILVDNSDSSTDFQIDFLITDAKQDWKLRATGFGQKREII